jgi:pimeloyl-ACP methyl ester carboxylesterase
MTKQKHFYLLRGLVREAGHWGDFVHLLAEAFPQDRVTTIDIPGAGEYFQETAPLSVNAMVSKMREKYLRTRKEGEEIILVSISLGGMISTCWMKNHPQDFHRAILINTSFGGISPMFHRLKPKAFLFLLKVPLLKGRQKEKRIIDLVLNHYERRAPVLDCWEQVENLRPVNTANALRQLYAASRFSCGDFRPDIPVLLLASTQDRMVNVECSRAISRKWGFKLVEHPTGGHELSNDDPAWVVKQIHSFVTHSEVSLET